MSGTTPRQDQGPCDSIGCPYPYGHRGKCIVRMCEREGCPNKARNGLERFCTRHESIETYERYWRENHPGEGPGWFRLI